MPRFAARIERAHLLLSVRHMVLTVIGLAWFVVGALVCFALAFAARKPTPGIESGAEVLLIAPWGESGYVGSSNSASATQTRTCSVEGMLSIMAN